MLIWQPLQQDRHVFLNVCSKTSPSGIQAFIPTHLKYSEIHPVGTEHHYSFLTEIRSKMKWDKIKWMKQIWTVDLPSTRLLPPRMLPLKMGPLSLALAGCSEGEPLPTLLPSFRRSQEGSNRRKGRPQESRHGKGSGQEHLKEFPKIPHGPLQHTKTKACMRSSPRASRVLSGRVQWESWHQSTSDQVKSQGSHLYCGDFYSLGIAVELHEVFIQRQAKTLTSQERELTLAKCSGHTQ